MEQNEKERRGLGRGLSALMADISVDDDLQDESAQSPARGPDANMPIERLRPNPDQPRRDFDKGDLDDLAASILEKGIIQPLIVRPDPTTPEHYQIVAGERRWRAAQQAQLHDIPVLVRDLSDDEVLELAIVENIQRADLNSVEEALGYRQLMDRFGHTQERLSEVLGKSRSHIANLLRLLSLPQEVLELLRGGDLTAGHARALVTADNPVALARDIVKKGLSVRQVEKLVKSPAAPRIKDSQNNTVKDADTKILEQDLTASVGLPVSLAHNETTSGGEVKIKYKSLDELDQICAVLSGA